ncbi:COX15/CtaA family protein [Flavobacteriales bacterium]|nr:COX15/CtaA family protein [Flavobacteriales bacterium]
MNKNKSIVIWLLSGCALIFIMVVVGGITRLTDSGLSMVKWNLFMGAIPPLNETEWKETFSLYKSYPEYQKVNFNFTLSEFKYIFFWEYLHRMIGRLLGLVFIIPFIYFLIKKRLNKKLIIQTSILLLMGTMQGAIGWWMVRSGLVNNPDVSHYRLAVHLITAFLTFAFTFWVVLPLILTKERSGNTILLGLTKILMLLIIVQIIYGAFVAGLNAGIGFNTWPKMGDYWIADVVFQLEPLWKNFVEGRYGVQFIHRILALTLVAFVIYIWKKGEKLELVNNQKRSLNLLLGIVLLQTLLGIFTLILVVPLWLAALHQIGAFFLIMATTYSLFIFSKS